jgi:YggT family protein
MMGGAFFYLIDMVLNVVQVLVLGSVIVSWVNADPRNPIVQMLRATTEPMYRPFRILTQYIPGPMDWAPLVLLLVVEFVRRLAMAALTLH